jgi:conjugal transfer pilus assembly protein TraF
VVKWLVLSFLLQVNLLYAQPYINTHERGWYWHNEPLEVLKKAKKPTKPPQAKPLDPSKVWKQIGVMVERARAQAILNPTSENIAVARRLQRLLVAQSTLFSEKWMLDLLLHPEEDESLTNPNNGAARDIYNHQNDLLKEKAIEAIAKTSGLVYFYEAEEPYSESMAVVLQNFAARYHMQILPIAMHNKASVHFPASRIDNGEAREMGVRHVPAVFAIHPLSKKAMPVAYGLISQSELKENIFRASMAFQPRGSYAR